MRLKSFSHWMPASDIRVKWIRRCAPGRSFVDVGSLWKVHGFFSFLAEMAGAKRVISVDIAPVTKEFKEMKKRLLSSVQFVQGDIHDHRTLEKVGRCDVVFCSGVLYHSPHPAYFLSRLRSMCGKTLILQTRVIQEVRGARNMAVFYPYLNASQRKLWKVGRGRQNTITTPYRPTWGYGNCFWGFSPSWVESMLQWAGFRVAERLLRFPVATYLCETKDFPPCG